MDKTKRRIPAEGINLFQLIYILIREYTEKTGLAPLNLSLGNPDTVPCEAIRELKARYARDRGFQYHTYAEDNNLESFAEGMVELHGRIAVSDFRHLRAVPIAGIKTALALTSLACGLHLPDKKRRTKFRLVSNLPAYDVIGTWTESFLGAERIVWPLSLEENMRMDLGRLTAALKAKKAARADLIVVIRPGNPASVGASRAEWKALIEYCVKNDTRLVNDAAYTALSGKNHIPLADVAKDYPELEWMELYSVSKSFSDPGARLGAAVGSRVFIEDYIVIKGNTDSGPVPSVMAAYGRFFQDKRATQKALDDLRALYEGRLEYLIPALKAAGMKQACETEAGFFTLWRTPRRAFGLDLEKYAKEQNQPVHEAFNRLVIAETGIVGVHFLGTPDAKGRRAPLIRYAVCTDVLDGAFQKRFKESLKRLNPEY